MYQMSEDTICTHEQLVRWGVEHTGIKTKGGAQSLLDKQIWSPDMLYTSLRYKGLEAYEDRS